MTRIKVVVEFELPDNPASDAAEAAYALRQVADSLTAQEGHTFDLHEDNRVIRYDIRAVTVSR